MHKVIIVLSFFSFLFPFTGSSQQKSKSALWQSLEQITNLSATEKKPILIDIYTDWCHYCKVMDATTYKNDSVINYLQKHFYRLKFNAESKDTIRWQQKVYAYNLRYEVHDFAVYLSRGSIVYPTTVIITPGGQPYYQHGQLTAGELELLLKYYADNRPGKPTLEDFAKTFLPAWK